MIQTHVTGFSVKDNLGLELFFPRIFFCSSLTRFSCSFLILCLSSSIKRCCSTIANLSSALSKETLVVNHPDCPGFNFFKDLPVSSELLLSFCCSPPRSSQAPLASSALPPTTTMGSIYMKQ